ncbi:MAG TPA: twin-arginine translocase subunit TatC [Candidatus Bathyarchaeia archaeon]|nr:twin-arginine translocase subunit TatC [Candidatus Bathyarchaeia archaeon]
MADEQATAPDPEADRALGKMSFMEHLGELRTRIMWSLVAAGVGIVIALFITDPVMRFISRPLAGMKTDLVFTSPTEAFWTWMKIAMVLGIFISMPGILYQVWKFVAPGLHEHEKKYAAPFIISGSLLFLLGGAFALLVIIPYASTFLVTFGQEKGWKPMLTVSSYTDFVIKFTLAFGIVFQLPVVIMILSLIGVVTPQFLSKNRKYAILVNFIIAAILTPTPDMINQTLMAGPLCILYEVGIICARIATRRRRKMAPPTEPASAA